ncbi:MAG: alpha-E domain-containing protein [Candidatus Symbiothrix sp.]|jgi:uncharacterized alpha-E superfamily protein|nr:alpha-E domain-containing protein [Candidatus Symbiothrix sp.]
MGETISNTKAQSLFWLGRYTQRVYLILHFLRKYRDVMIDEDENAYCIFCEKLGVENRYTSCENFLHAYLFDKSNSSSLISALAQANNNATLLRGEIKSETFSYIQMSICHIERCAEHSVLEELQPVTDSLLAFWGSVDERIYRRDARNMIKAGKYLETLDLHIRFEYPHERIIYFLDRLERHVTKEKSIFDQDLFLEVKEEIKQCDYNKVKALSLISRLFIVI